MCDWELHTKETSLEIVFPNTLAKAATTTIAAEGREKKEWLSSQLCSNFVDLCSSFLYGKINGELPWGAPKASAAKKDLPPAVSQRSEALSKVERTVQVFRKKEKMAESFQSDESNFQWRRALKRRRCLAAPREARREAGCWARGQS